MQSAPTFHILIILPLLSFVFHFIKKTVHGVGGIAPPGMGMPPPPPGPPPMGRGMPPPGMGRGGGY